MTVTDRRHDSGADYREAAVTLWGDAGAFVHDAYADWLRMNLFPGLPERLPIVIGITAYGRCDGLTRSGWAHGPRITIASNAFAQGANFVADTVLHEMVHAWLWWIGQHTDHDSDGWYKAVRKLSPSVLGHSLDVRRGAQRRSVRAPNPSHEPGVDDRKSIVRKIPVDGALTHKQVAGWPSTFRPDDHDWGEVIDCPSY